MHVAYIINFTDKHAWILNWPNHCDLLCISSLDAVDKLTYQSTAQTTIRATWIDSPYNLWNCHLHAVTNIMNFTWRTFQHLEMINWNSFESLVVRCVYGSCHNSNQLHWWTIVHFELDSLFVNCNLNCASLVVCCAWQLPQLIIGCRGQKL